MPIKHLTPRNESEVCEYFSKMSLRELFNLGVIDGYAQTVLNARLRCKRLDGIQAEYLWHDSNMNANKSAYVQVEYTMTFIIDHKDIPFFKSIMIEDFGESFTIDEYNFETEQLVIRFRS